MEVEQIESPEVEQLSVILSEGGLELTEAEVIKQSYLPYFEQMSQVKKESAKIDFENPSEIDEKKAAKAPDKTKMVTWVESMDIPDHGYLKLSTEDAIRMSNEIYDKFYSFKKWAKSKIAEL